MILSNTILARNHSGRRDCVGPVTSLGNNLLGDPTGCAITLRPTDLTGDPGLGDFTDNGTPGNDHFPLLPAMMPSVHLPINWGSHRSGAAISGRLS